MPRSAAPTSAAIQVADGPPNNASGRFSSKPSAPRRMPANGLARLSWVSTLDRNQKRAATANPNGRTSVARRRARAFQASFSFRRTCAAMAGSKTNEISLLNAARDANTTTRSHSFRVSGSRASDPRASTLNSVARTSNLMDDQSPTINMPGCSAKAVAAKPDIRALPLSWKTSLPRHAETRRCATAFRAKCHSACVSNAATEIHQYTIPSGL